MTEYGLSEIELKFAELIWENEPIASGELTDVLFLWRGKGQ